MKNLYFLSLFIVLTSSCKSNLPATALSQINSDSDCPNDGSCEIIVHENKALAIKTDQFGKLYYELEDNKNKKVVVYSYNRAVPEGIQDGHYKEEIILEVFNGVITINTSDSSSKEIKTLFGRFCYCKGYTGYYSILDRTLKIETKNNQQYYDFAFTVKDVPQIIKHITFSLK